MRLQQEESCLASRCLLCPTKNKQVYAHRIEQVNYAKVRIYSGLLFRECLRKYFLKSNIDLKFFYNEKYMGGVNGFAE